MEILDRASEPADVVILPLRCVSRPNKKCYLQDFVLLIGSRTGKEQAPPLSAAELRVLQPMWAGGKVLPVWLRGRGRTAFPPLGVGPDGMNPPNVYDFYNHDLRATPDVEPFVEHKKLLVRIHGLSPDSGFKASYNCYAEAYRATQLALVTAMEVRRISFFVGNSGDTQPAIPRGGRLRCWLAPSPGRSSSVCVFIGL